MTIAKPPADASDGEIVRWTFEVLDAHDVAALRTIWTDATVERFPSATIHGAAGAALNARTRLLARVRPR